MIFNDYVKLATRTESTAKDLNDLNLRLLHAALGMATEIIELEEDFFKVKYKNFALDHINVKIECGDVFWYIAIAADVLNLNITEIFKNPQYRLEISTTPPYHSEMVKIEVGNFLDIIKRHIFYRKLYNIDKIKEILTNITIEMCKLVYSLNFDLDDVLEKNISKLRSRYPDKYSDILAIERDSETERKLFSGE